MKKSDIVIRKYKREDCSALSKLFYETVHSVNARDYTERQLNAWAENENSLMRKAEDLERQYTLIAESNGSIVGFGSIDESGCLDFLFVHKDYQGRGIGTSLCEELEKGFSELKTYASVTAKPFNKSVIVFE